MISEAGVILNPSSRGTPLRVPPNPIVIFRSALSFISITLFHKMVRGSIFKEHGTHCKLLSINAESKLLAFSTALKSPVKCKFISSMGTTCE